MKYFLIIATALLATTTARAQNTLRLSDDNDVVAAKNLQVTPAEGRTILTLDIVLDNLRVPSNRYRAFTPVIRSLDDTTLVTRMKTLIVSGRTQDIIFERDGIDELYRDNCEKIRRYNGTEQTYAYTDAIERQPWHQNAQVLLECDLCGCGDKKKNQEFPLATLKQLDPWELTELANQEPDTYKPMRELHGTAYITFVVDRWEMKPDYMDNYRELRKITDTLDIMVADPNITVNRIKIHGWASPESPYNHNHMLATNRAKSLTEWLRQNYQLPVSAFAPAEATPENWLGLQEALPNLDATLLPHKSEIAGIVSDLLQQDSTVIAKTADATEARIKKLYPQEYMYLLKNIYPGLRRSDYEITFNIKQFNTIQECLDIYRTKPHQLSRHELWQVAQTMKPFSDEYNRVMQTTLNYYPDDETANVNLAAVALSQRDILKAKTLLQHAGNGGAAEQLRAVIDIVEGNYDTAKRHLDAAERKGINVAKNREAIRLLTQ
ncbi:MAG: hypothetical protein IKH32_03825 [Prevotella sp.]|jgi:hypothetical protein|nr:hypothetical protein [Prevotella sp.]MBR3479819.1 hypothetical protein [Prevotella sp.]